MAKTSDSQNQNRVSTLRLESLYNQYGANIYSLCVRVLTRARSAEDATVDTFVRFWRCANPDWDDTYSNSRLRDFAIEACHKRVRRGSLWKRWSFSLR